MMEDTGEDVLRQRPSIVMSFFRRIGQVSHFHHHYLHHTPSSLIPLLQTYQLILDKWTPHTATRWVATVLLMVAFGIRIFVAQVGISLAELEQKCSLLI